MSSTLPNRQGRFFVSKRLKRLRGEISDPLRAVEQWSQPTSLPWTKFLIKCLHFQGLLTGTRQPGSQAARQSMAKYSLTFKSQLVSLPIPDSCMCLVPVSVCALHCARLLWV